MKSRTRLTMLAICAAVLFPGAARAEPLPPELNLVPRDAALFVSIRVSDLWNESRLKPLRDFLIEEGRLLRDLEKDVGFRPDDVERVSIVCPTFNARNVLSEPLIIVTLKKPYDLSKLLDTWDGMTEVEYRRFTEEQRFPKGVIIAPKGFPVPAPPKLIEEKFPAPPPKPLRKEPLGEKEKPAASDCEQKAEPDDPPVRAKNRPRDLKAPYYFLGRLGGLLIPLNERTIVIAMDNGFRERTALPDLLSVLLKRSEKGPLSATLEAAAGKHALVLGVNLPAARNAIPEKSWANALPIDSLMKCRSATATLDIGEEVRLALHIDGPDEATAKRVLDVIRSVHILGMECLPGLKKMLDDDDSPGRLLLTLIEPILRDAKFELKGTTASVVMASRIDEQLAKSIKDSIEKIREAALRARAQNNLKHFGVAIHNYASANNGDQLPFPGMLDGNRKKVLLSWRVAILPYIEEAQLYTQFKFDEPWDSDHNKKLIEKMPKIFAPLGGATAPAGQTYYRTFIGGGAIGDGRFNIGNIIDGTMNTIFVVEAGESVIWTKPDEIPFDPLKPLPKLGGHFKGKMNVLMGDGSVRTIDLTKMSPRTLKLAIQADDGLPLPADWDQR